MHAYWYMLSEHGCLIAFLLNNGCWDKFSFNRSCYEIIHKCHCQCLNREGARGVMESLEVEVSLWELGEQRANWVCASSHTHISPDSRAPSLPWGPAYPCSPRLPWSPGGPGAPGNPSWPGRPQDPSSPFMPREIQSTCFFLHRAAFKVLRCPNTKGQSAKWTLGPCAELLLLGILFTTYSPHDHSSSSEAWLRTAAPDKVFHPLQRSCVIYSWNQSTPQQTLSCKPRAELPSGSVPWNEL